MRKARPTSNHTPGPWRCVPSAAGTWTIYTDGPPGISGADETLIAHGIRVEANALVLTAAPQLLEALEQLLVSATKQRNGYRDRGLQEPWNVTEARAKLAILEAKGEERRTT